MRKEIVKYINEKVNLPFNPRNPVKWISKTYMPVFRSTSQKIASAIAPNPLLLPVSPELSQII